jgi:RNA polymerase sigma factor FliA
MQTVHQHIWKEYRDTRSHDLKSELFYSYLRLVKYVVRKFAMSPGSSKGVIERKDLMQVGMMGLLEAIERYDPGRGIKFETFALSRIQGSIQDELRRIDWLPRSERKRIREARGDQALQVESKYGYSIGAFDMTLTREGLTRLNELEERGGGQSANQEIADTTPDIREQMNNNDIVKLISDQIEKLNERDRLVITLYYYEEMKFREIGEVLGLTESRVSQIHSSVIGGLRKKMETLEVSL